MAAAPSTVGTKPPVQNSPRSVYAAVADDMPPRLPPQVPRVLMPTPGSQRSSRPTQSARGVRDGRREVAQDRPASRGARGVPEDSFEQRALKRIFAKKTKLEARYQDAAATGSDNTIEGTGNSIVDQFLYQLNETAPARLGTVGHASTAAEEVQQSTWPGPDSGTSPEYAAWLSDGGVPMRSLVDGRGSARLGKEVKELKAKVVRMERERHKLQAQLSEREERVRQLEEDIKRIRSDPQMLHPAIQRLRKVGLNTPALQDLNERWAGYVLGRTSMAMEVGSYAFRAVFGTHAQNGVLTEDSFKSVIRQFEPTIKNDQLTRLWFFADSDGSGQLDLFEFMRMFGCNANGDMSDEYYEVVTMHMYRKFHSRGGIRRVYAAADRDQDQCLSPEEWEIFLYQCKLGLSRQDFNMTKQEMCQVFYRMNTSNTGLLSIVEFEAALEAAASKCYVSEKWVRDTFHSTAVAIQDEGMSIRQLIPTTNLTVKEFKDLMLRFTPRLRMSQLDRLWKYVLSQIAIAEDRGPRAAESSNRVDTDAFLKIAFCPTLGASSSSISEPGIVDSNDGTFVPPPSTGKEVLEQLAILLRKHTGDVPLELCFESLDPFVTPDHFHKQLLTKFGLQYDTIKTKQMFSLIDMDRDGKITRYEFLSTFKRILRSGDGSADSSASDTGTEVCTKMRENRLLNRLHVMESEMRQYRRDPIASAAGNYGEVISMVPEKQYRTLEVAHAKLNQMIQREREISAKRARSASPPRHERGQYRSDPIERNEATACEEERQSTKSFQVGRSSSEHITFFDRDDSHHDRRVEQLEEKVAQLSANKAQLVKDFDTRIEGLLAENDYLRGRLDSAMNAGVQEMANFLQKSQPNDGSPSGSTDTSPRASPFNSSQPQAANDSSGRLSLKDLKTINLENAVQQFLDQEVGTQDNGASKAVVCSCGNTFAPDAAFCRKCGKGRKEVVAVCTCGNEFLPDALFCRNCGAKRPEVGDTASERHAEADTSQNPDMKRRSTLRKRVTITDEKSPMRDSIVKTSRGSTRLSQVSRFGSQGRAASILVPAEVMPELVGKARRALWNFQQDKRPLRERISCLNDELVGAIVEDRFRIDQVVSVSQKTILTYCWDLLLNSVVSLRLLYDTKMRHRRDFSYEACVMSKLMSIPHIPTVYHFSGANSSLVFFAMELLEGETLASRFLAVQEERAEPITHLEAMEVADALLNGVDQCHQQDVVNLSIRPDTIWIAPPLSAARVRILSWENALPINSQPINAEFQALAEDRRLELSKSPPKLARGTDEADVSTKGSFRATLMPGKVYASKVDRAFPNMFVKDVGSLYYMPPEHLYSVIDLHEADTARGGNWEWAAERIGPAAKVDGPVVHWFQRGNGLVMTATPVACVPLGRLFEVEIHKIMTMVRRGFSDLGFCIGLTTASPYRSGFALVGDREKILQEAFFASGDCSYCIRGKRLLARAHGMGVEEINSLAEGITDTEGRYMILPEGLRRGDRVGLLAEWNGDLSVYINGEQVGSCPNALRPSDAYGQLYGIVDLYTREGADEHYVRAITLSGESQLYSQHFGGERGSKKAQELKIIHDLVHTSVETQLGVACDVYACGLVLLQCFRGGRHVPLPPSLETFQYAFSVWVAEKCPKLEGEFYLLAAILNLLTEREPSLADLESPKLRNVLARALKKSRYSRLDSCWEFSLLLNKATGWQDMNTEFLTSHITAVEQAKRRHAAEEHLSRQICRRSLSFDKLRKSKKKKIKNAEDGEDEKEHSSEGSGEETGDGQSEEESEDEEDVTARKAATAEVNHRRSAGNPESRPVIAVWDLQLHTLGHSHLTRVVQVVTEWAQKASIRVLAVRALGAYIPEQLQMAFVSCFNSDGPPHEGGCLRESHHKKKRKQDNAAKRQEDIWKAMMSGLNFVDEGELPTLMLEDLPLPAASLPKQRFPLDILLKRHLLWLVTHFVANLDLEPGPETVSDGRFTDSPAIGDSRALVNELSTAVSRSRVLTHLNLRSSNLGETGGVKLAAAIKACPQLQSLDVSNNDLGPKAATKIVVAADQGNNLTFLDLSRNSILDIGMQNLSDALAQCKKLSTIRLGQNQFGQDGSDALAECILTNTSLTSLNLCHNQLSVHSVLTLIRVTQATCTLKELDFEHNLPWPSYGGSEFVLQQLADCLGGHATDFSENVRTSCLTSLSLRHCNVRSECAAKLFEALARNSTLEKLNISWNGIRYLGTVELARMLAEPRCKVRELDLRDNQVGTQDALGHALQEVFWRMSATDFSTINVRLQTLHLGNNELTANSVKLLVESLPAFVGLEELMLYHNPEIGQQGGQAIARLLSTNNLVGLPKLRRLSVAICGLGDVGCRAVASTLRTNDRLTALDLSGNHITDNAATMLADALRSNRTLQTLGLGMNFLTSIGLRHFMDALSTNDSSHINEIDVSAQAEPDFESLVGVSDEVLSKFVGLSR